MQLLFAYLLKLAFCLALGYLFYFAVLSRMTWYNWNRYFLLFFPLAAMAIPLLPVQVPDSIPAINAVYFITDALPSAAAADTVTAQASGRIPWSINTIVLWVMLAGMGFFLLRFLLRLYSLQRTRAASQLVNNGDVKLYHLEGCTAPFSFYNSIYLDTNNYDRQDLEKIIAHELVHITQKHTLDTMVSEVLCIVQWFNPFVWMIKHAIKQNLEFIADDEVLQKGINRTGYQYLLLKVSGAMPHSLANNLLFPSLKKRIQMMNRTKTGKLHLLKFIWIVPLACVLLFAFSAPSGHPPVRNNASDAFSLSSLSFYTNDANIVKLIQKDQSNSLLKEGGALSLALLNEEKTRLKTLLEKNGYDTSGGRAISFVMDTSATSQSFSVKVVIELQQSKLKKSPAETVYTGNTINTQNSTARVHLSEQSVTEPPGRILFRLNNNGVDQLVMQPVPGK
jgi:beta-lactamase regulating signal transducer with metallopeptidase domain